MLVLTRGVGESIVVNGDTIITINEIRDGMIRLGIDAPRHVIVDRLEIHKIKLRDQQEGRHWPRDRIDE